MIDRSGCPCTGKHGTVSAYRRRGCTCPDAQQATLRYEKLTRCGRLEPGFIPALGTRRRLQALAAIGHSSTELGRRLGCTGANVRKIRAAATVLRPTAARIHRLFAELAMTPGVGAEAAMTRAHARRAGWWPPLAWDDIDDPAETPRRGRPSVGEVDALAVEHAAAGLIPFTRLHGVERAVVVAQLTAAGLSIRQIADRLRITERRVQIRRAQTRPPATATAPNRGEQRREAS